MFVLNFFLDKLITNVGQFVAKKMIASELRNAQNPRFLERVVLVFQSRSAPSLPAYQEAVKSLPSPPSYTEPE